MCRFRSAFAGHGHEPVSDHARQRARLFRCRRHAAVVPAIGRLLDQQMRTRARALRTICSTCVRHGLRVAGRRPTSASRRARVHARDACAGAAGERIPADGLVVAGISDIDDSLLTGETATATSRPAPGLCRHAQSAAPVPSKSTATDEGSLLAEITRLMEAAEQGTRPLVRLADRASRIYAPAVHVLGLTTFLGWLRLATAGSKH